MWPAKPPAGLVIVHFPDTCSVYKALTMLLRNIEVIPVVKTEKQWEQRLTQARCGILWGRGKRVK